MTKKPAEKIQSRFAEIGTDVNIDEITKRLDDLVGRFKVPLPEAERSVVSYFLRENSVSSDDYYTSAHGESETTHVADIDRTEIWVDLEVVVTKLWDNDNESIDQTGLIADATGQIKFVKWTVSELPPLEEGKSYVLTSLITDEFNDRFSVKFVRTSTITELDNDIKPFTQDQASGDRVNPFVEINNIKDSNKWISLRAKVVQLWDSEHDSIDQVGLVGDETGVIRFVKFMKSALPALEEGKSYSIENMTTGEYDDQFSVKMNRTTVIKELTEDIDTSAQVKEFMGAMVHIQDGSGLIRRCPECNAALMKGVCRKHGAVEGVHDLRIKMVLDDGEVSQEALLNRELTEEITGITLDGAKEMAIEALDPGIVQDQMKEILLGRYYTISGKVFDRHMLVDSIVLVED